MKTREEIFAKSGQLFPDYGSVEHYNKSLGFEEGATWNNAQSKERGDVPTRAEVVAQSGVQYPIDPKDEIDVLIGEQRRRGFIWGATWAVDGMLD